MAAAKKQIKIEITGDSKKAVDAVQDVDKAVGKTKKETKSLGEIAKGMAQGIGQSITNFAVSAVKELVSNVLNLAKEFKASETKITNALGVSGEEAEKLNETVKDIWKDGFADLEDATNAVIQLKRAFKDMNDDELENTSRGVLAISNVFDQDLNKTIDATTALVNEFGLSYEQSLDMITAGLQDINPAAADDLLDTFSEYSTVMAEAGFSAQDFYNILQSGTNTGVLGTDKIADAMKEFSIRMTDGSKQTREALADLYDEVGRGNPEMSRLTSEFQSADVAIRGAKENVALWEQEMQKNADTVSELSDRLQQAKRDLDDLSRPKLEGMEEYDNQLFVLGQNAKKLRLAMLDMVPDSDKYKATEEQLKNINKEIDRVSLQRDIEFEPQLRWIARAAQEAEEPVLTFGQAIQQIGDKKTEIAGLTAELGQASIDAKEAELQFNYWNTQLDLSEAKYAALKDAIADLKNPSQELLDAIANGSISVRDALPQVLEMLNKIDDPIKRNEIGVALFGTAFEDLGASAILGIQLAETQLDSLMGKLDELVTNLQANTNQQESAWRDVQLALLPLSEELNRFITEIIIPLAQEYAPALATGVKFLTDMFNEQDTTVQGVNTTVSGFKILLDVLMAPINLLISGIELFISILVNLKAAFDGIISVGTAVSNIAKDISNSFSQALIPIKSLITYTTQLSSKLANIKAPAWLSNAGEKAKGLLPKIPGFASGGTYPSDKPFIVGEKGAELMIPNGSSGSVVPNDKLSGLGSTLNAPIVMNFYGKIDDKTVSDMDTRIHNTLNRLIQGKVF